MGNVKVTYKQRRGANEAGAEISTAVDFFTEILKEQFSQTKALFDSLPPSKQEEFLNLFDGELDMTNEQTAGVWINENIGERDCSQEMNAIKAMMAQCQAVSVDQATI